ncbi:hypothetical protein DFP72DRAFT_1018271 [Ephemerocybe angulata]|uniref:GST N-terminal domain-containing protein n=1 Tax=Ephemerocybe angulata TaxID=980116 RepID=A0A8H6HFS1_9AGAR|nr:hypothetical protein DFP72DRAFT_1018271 [Tulosesus angulatus]
MVSNLTANQHLATSKMSSTLTFYDFEQGVPGKTVSPWAAKVRIVLNYKGLKHRTVFFRYLEIEKRSIELGIPANEFELKADGSPKWTIPSLQDPTTNESLSDSLRIIDYLDRTYPETPQMLTPETVVAALAFEAAVGVKIAESALGDGEKITFRKFIEGFLGMTLEEWKSDPKNGEEAMKALKEGFDTFEGLIFKKADLVAEARGLKQQGPFIGGEKLTYVDAALGAVFHWMENLFGEDSAEWKQVTEWSNGRWGRYYKNIKPYTVVHD